MALTSEGSSPLQPFISSAAAKRTSHNAAALTLTAILTKGLLFLWQIFLARSLGVEMYGVYGTISALMIIGASIPEFGIGLIVIRDVASSPQHAGRYLAATLSIQPLLAVVGYIALAIVAASLGYDAGLRGLLAIAALSLLIDTLGNMAYNQLIAFERMVVTSIIAVGYTAVLIILGIVALTVYGSLWSVYLMILAAGCLRLMAHWITLLRMGIRPVFPVMGTLIRYLLVNGAPFALAAFISLTYINSDKLLATLLIGPGGTGQLMASFVIVFGVTELLSTPILVTIFPLMSRLYNSGKYDTFNLVLEKVTFFTLLMSLPVAIDTSLLAVPLSRLVFGNGFDNTATVLRIMIWYTVITMIVNVFSQALAVQNRQRRWLLARVIGLVLGIALNLILLPRLGIRGTALAMVVTETVVLMLILRSLDLPHIGWRRMIAHVWRLAIAMALLTVITLLLAAAHPLLAVVVGLPVFTGVLIIARVITEEDRGLLYQLVAEMPGGATITRFWKQ